MKKILEKYSACEMFSLSTGYNNEGITAEDAQKALKILHESNRKYLKKMYEKNREQYQLLEFDVLYQEVKEGCLQLKSKMEASEKEDKEDAFSYETICDYVGMSTKYSRPNELFWHFYDMIGRELLEEQFLKEKMEQCCKKNPYYILEEKVYLPLKPWAVGYEYSFITHCTEGGLSNTIYFKLNKETKAWLMQFKNDFEIKGELDDLAFYKGGEIVFSSCTHERFHLDIEKLSRYRKEN